MTKFKLYFPKDGNWEEREAFVANMYALQEAFIEGKVERAIVRLTGEQHIHCDHVRPVGVWKANNLFRAAIGYSPVGALGEQREDATELRYIEFWLR